MYVCMYVCVVHSRSKESREAGDDKVSYSIHQLSSSNAENTVSKVSTTTICR